MNFATFSAKARRFASARRRLVLYSALIGLVGVGGLWWVLSPELGIHLFSEAIEVFVASLVVDRLIEWERDARLEPTRRAAFADACAAATLSNQLILSLARSSVPLAELERVKAEKSFGPADWLGAFAGRIDRDSVAPYGAPPPWGTGFITWAEALPSQVNAIRGLINRYMMRHVAHAEGILTEAVHNVEENGLFRSLESGPAIFWGLPPDLRGAMFKHFIEKIAYLDGVIGEIDKRGGPHRGAFAWSVLISEMEIKPAFREREPWRPKN